MRIAHIKNNIVVAYPVDINYIKTIFPNVAFNSDLSAVTSKLLNELGKYENDSVEFFDVVVENIPYEYANHKTKKIVKHDLKPKNGIWTDGYDIVDKSIEEIEYSHKVLCDNVRVQRNMFLSECDWTQMPDNTLTEDQKNQWKNYRQKLRDITELDDFPENIIWPDKP